MDVRSHNLGKNYWETLHSVVQAGSSVGRLAGWSHSGLGQPCRGGLVIVVGDNADDVTEATAGF